MASRVSCKGIEVLVGFFAIVPFLILLRSDVAKAEGLSDRLEWGNHFAVARNSAAFPVRVRDGRLVLLLIDFETKRLRKLGVEGAHLLSPFLSPDGKLDVRSPSF